MESKQLTFPMQKKKKIVSIRVLDTKLWLLQVDKRAKKIKMYYLDKKFLLDNGY